MRWLFETKKDEGRHRGQEEENRKREEAARMMADLFIRHYGVAAAAIIGELERIHRFYAVPSWVPSGERGSYLYEIAKDLSQNPLPPEETGRLVAALLWPEFRAYKDRSAPSCFVLAAIHNPSEGYIPTLSRHVAWLEEEIKPLGSSQYRTDVASEIRLTKAAIQACRLRP